MALAVIEATAPSFFALGAIKATEADNWWALLLSLSLYIYIYASDGFEKDRALV